MEPLIFFHSSSFDSTSDTNGLCAGLGDENGLTFGDCLGDGTVKGFINPVIGFELVTKLGGATAFATDDGFNILMVPEDVLLLKAVDSEK